MAEDNLLEVAQVAKRLKVSEWTIRRMVKDPECPLDGVKIYRGCLRIKESSVSLCLVAKGASVKRSII